MKKWEQLPDFDSDKGCHSLPVVGGAGLASGASDTSMASGSSGVSSPGPPPFSPPGESVEEGALGAESVEDGELSAELAEGVVLGAGADGIAPSNAGAWTVQARVIGDRLGDENTNVLSSVIYPCQSRKILISIHTFPSPGWAPPLTTPDQVVPRASCPRPL